MAISVTVPVLVQMTDEQEERFAAYQGLPASGGKLYAKDVVKGVQDYVLLYVQESTAFGETGAGDGTRGATVTIKRR